MENHKLPSGIKITILWIISIGLFGIFLSIGSSAGNNALWSMSLFSSIYFLLAFGLVKGKKWAWWGIIINSILWGIWFNVSVWVCPDANCSNAFNGYIHFYIINIIISLLNITVLLYFLLKNKQRFWKIRSQKLTFINTILFLIIIIFIILFNIFIFKEKENNQYNYQCAGLNIAALKASMSATLPNSIMFYDDNNSYEGYAKDAHSFKYIYDIVNKKNKIGCNWGFKIYTSKDKYCNFVKINDSKYICMNFIDNNVFMPRETKINPANGYCNETNFTCP